MVKIYKLYKVVDGVICSTEAIKSGDYFSVRGGQDYYHFGCITMIHKKDACLSERDAINAEIKITKDWMDKLSLKREFFENRYLNAARLKENLIT